MAGALLAGSIAAVAVANGHAGSAPHPLLPVVVLAGHLLAASVWAGGLAALVLLALPAWRTPAPADLDASPGQSLAREVLFRFSRLALFSTAALIVTGVLGSRGNLGVLANLWRVAYGRMLLAKLVLLAVALVLGARHLLVLPRRLAVAEPAGRGPRGLALASFERTSRAEAVVLVAAVAVAAALVSAVPGRFAQVAAAHPVDMRQAIGGHSVELVVAPTGPGPNQLLLSFVGGDGVLVEGLDRATATLRQPDGSTRPLDLTALSSGAFSASVSLPTAGAYRVAVSDPAGNSTTFSFKVPRPLRG
jgi:copper transport protein